MVWDVFEGESSEVWKGILLGVGLKSGLYTTHHVATLSKIKTILHQTFHPLLLLLLLLLTKRTKKKNIPSGVTLFFSHQLCWILSFSLCGCPGSLWLVKSHMDTCMRSSMQSLPPPLKVGEHCLGEGWGGSSATHWYLFVCGSLRTIFLTLQIWTCWLPPALSFVVLRALALALRVYQ